MIRGLGSIRLQVRDLERSVAFYRGGLRFALAERDNSEQCVHLHAGSLRLVLQAVPEAEESSARRARGGGIALGMEIAGVDAYHDALVERGISPSPPVDEDGSRSFTVSDPDGYRWCFRQSMD